ALRPSGSGGGDGPAARRVARGGADAGAGRALPRAAAEARVVRGARARAARHRRGHRPGCRGGTCAAGERGGRAGMNARRLVMLGLALLLLGGFGIGDLERGNRLYRAGRYAEAVEAYRAALADGTDTPQLRYNLGTA